MRKNKIYGKLFEFCDVRTWSYIDGVYFSNFYKEYKLTFCNDGFGWFYCLYPYKYNDYASKHTYKGLVTLNKTGKVFMTLGLLTIILCTGKFFYDFIPVYFIIISSLFSFLLSFFYISIFNWKLYIALRKVQYFIRNEDNIKKREEDELLDKNIISIVNDTIAKYPKLARKTKLNQLNKRYNPLNRGYYPTGD